MTKRQLLVAAFAGLCQTQMIRLSQASDFQRQYYHATRHPPDVYTGSRRVGICVLSEKYNQGVDDLIYMACMAHDVIQEADEVQKDGFAFRARRRGPNEQKTADWAREALLQLRREFGEDTITDQEIESVHKAILWTTPVWHPELKTVTQPLVWKALEEGDIDPVPLSVAMGDLLPPGHHPEAFLAASDGLFVEEWPGIDRLLREAKNQSDIPADRAAAALEIMRRFDAGQADFAVGRAKAFKHEVSYLPANARQELEKRVNRFKESDKRAQWRAEERRSLDFFRYASAMGFKDVPIE